MITSVQFENFKSLRNISIDLEPFTVLVGANGSGKSSLLQGIRQITSFFYASEHTKHRVSRMDKVFQGPNTADRLVSMGADHLLMGFTEQTFGAFSCRWIRPKDPAQIQSSSTAHYHLSYDGPPDHCELSYPNAAQEEAFFDGLPKLQPATLLHLDPALLANAAYSDDADPHISMDGSGVAPTLQKLQVLRDGRFEQIEEGLNKIVPSILRLRAVPAPVKRHEHQRVTIEGQDFNSMIARERTGARIQADVRGSGWIDADLLSEGTLLVLALLTALQDETPSLLLLDDIDRALHPLAQGRLMGVLRAIQAARTGLQILTTTHSPFVVDHCTIEEVRVIRLDDNGTSHCLPLASHPRWERRKGFMKPGEFWSGVGESWIGG